jgi:hypothetical protein
MARVGAKAPVLRLPVALERITAASTGWVNLKVMVR